MTYRWTLVPIFLAVLFSFAGVASAASLTFGGNRDVSVGQNITIPVYVSTVSGESANAIEATVNFPTSKLRVVSIADDGIIDLWAERPSFSNAAGTAGFQGVVYNPGLTGSNGRVVAITFRALAEGTAELTFTDRSVLANDGEGTEILRSSGSADIRIAAAAAAPERPAETAVQPAQAEAQEEATATSPELGEQSTETPVQAQESRSGEYVFNLSIPYGFLVDLSEIIAAFMPVILVLVGLSGWIFFGMWLGWHRMHSVRRTLLRRIASTDNDLHADLMALHEALEEEVTRLREKEEKNTLTEEERHIMSRFGAMLENMTEVKSWHFKPLEQRKKRSRS